MFKTITPQDSTFRFSPDGITLVPRAGFAIANRCPGEYRAVITECLNNGWLTPIAYMPDAEYAWEKLKS